MLNLAAGIFYEFIPVSDFYKENPNRISLEDVRLNVNYVLILNTNAGLWGYNIGDTIQFTSLNPYKIIITGRLKHFTSAFGEHVIAQEVEKALALTIQEIPASINEFHVYPEVNPDVNALPHHVWLIEFDELPKNLNQFAKKLDQNLQQLNPYYLDLIQGKILQTLQIKCLEKGTFLEVLKQKGPLDAQNKLPRLANNQDIAESVLSIKKINQTI